MDYKVASKHKLLGNWYVGLRKLDNELNSISNEVDLSFDQFLMMEQIIEEKHDSPKELAKFFATSMPAVSRKLNSLQAKCYIRKQRGMQIDQRILRVELTTLGYDKYQELVEKFELSQIDISTETMNSLNTMVNLFDRKLKTE